jgi:sarcosine oxidase subunit gamma
MRLGSEAPWGELPQEVGGLTLAAVALDRVTEVLAIGGADLSEAFREAVGVGLPAVGRTEAADGVRVVWSGREAVLVLGAAVEVEGALCVDQSDGWVGLELEGGVREVLARLCPLDLRDGSFPVGAAARSLLNHVPVLLARVSEGGWLLLAPSSMAGTVLEELAEAARGVASR